MALSRPSLVSATRAWPTKGLQFPSWRRIWPTFVTHSKAVVAFLSRVDAAVDAVVAVTEEEEEEEVADNASPVSVLSRRLGILSR